MFEGLHLKFLGKELEGTEVMREGEGHCQICWEKLGEGVLMTKTRCSHTFHMICLRKWLEIRNVCPLCKQSVLKEISIDDNV